MSKRERKERVEERVERTRRRKERLEKAPKEHECVWRTTRLGMRECVTTRTRTGCYDLQ